MTVDDIISEQTVEQVKAFLYSVADSFGLKTTAWQKLSPLRTMFAIVSQLFAGYTSVQAVFNRGSFLSTATGNRLTVLAKEVYDVDRDPATFAPGFVTVDNAGGGLYSFGVGDLVVLATAIKKTYHNTAAVTINPLETGVIIAIEADEVGSASTAAPGQIDDFASALPSLTVTNADEVVGDDEESDDDLRARCLEKLSALSPNGASDAYVFVATTPSLNGGVDITRAKVLEPPGDGTVTVVIAGPDGEVDPGDVTTVDDALHELVVREVDTEYTVSATAVTVSLVGDIYISVDSGLTDPEVDALAQQAVTNYIAGLPIGGIPLQGGPTTGVSWRALEAIIRAANSNIYQAKLDPETDTVLGETEVAVAGPMTFTIHLVG